MNDPYEQLRELERAIITRMAKPPDPADATRALAALIAEHGIVEWGAYRAYDGLGVDMPKGAAVTLDDIRAICRLVGLIGFTDSDPAKCDHDVCCAKCGMRWHTQAEVPTVAMRGTRHAG